MSRTVHLALYFPGGTRPPQDPFEDRLAWITIRTLEQAGAVVEPVRYDSFDDWDVFEAGIRRDALAALDRYRPDQLTLVGKSAGTHALGYLCTGNYALPADTRLVWLTPVWQWDDSWAAACHTRLPALHVVGLADAEYHLPERHAAVVGETVSIPGADHRLEVANDIFATLNAWRTMAAAVMEFVRRD